MLFHLNSTADQFFSTFWTVHIIRATQPGRVDRLITACICLCCRHVTQQGTWLSLSYHHFVKYRRCV
jgi:hypothetical protein